MTGPVVRTDLVDVYVFHRVAPGSSTSVELLQLRRAREPHAGTWHPVMGAIEAGERAPDAARRELAEETGLGPADAAWRGMWALELVQPYYVAPRDEVWLTPRFAVEAAPGWEPVLNHEHDAHRWVAASDAPRAFLWAGQAQAVAQTLDMLAVPERAERLRLM